MKNIVVIGGAGFMGASLVAELANRGYQVTSVSRSAPAMLKPQGNVSNVDCQYDNFDQLAPIYQSADVIFHFAWDTTPATSASSPLLEVTGNLLPSARLIEWLQDHSTALLIFISSGGTVYGSHLDRPALEEDQLRPVSNYGAAKAAVEQFVEVFSARSGRSAVILRPSNVYGPGQIPKRQFGVIPTLMMALLEDKPFTLIGGEETTRDFVFIDDFVSACCALVTNKAVASRSLTTLNIASGQPVQLLELVRVVEEASARKLTLQSANSRPVDVSNVSLAIGAARDLLDWKPHTALHAGIEKTWQWIKRGSW